MLYFENSKSDSCFTFIIGLGNGLMPSGNKPFRELELTQIPNAIQRHYATMG